MKPEVIVTTNGTSVYATLGSTRVNGVKSGDNFVIVLPSTGTWTVTAVKDSTTRSTSVSVSKIARYIINIEVIKIVSWEEATDAEIVAMVQALDEGKLTVEETGWKVGDSRYPYVNYIRFSPFYYYDYNGNRYQKTNHTDYLEILNIGGKTFNGNGNSLDGKECHFVVGFKYGPPSTQWTNTADNVYSSSRLREVEENYYNALPETIKPIFKKFNVVTGVYNDSTTGGTNVTSQQYLTTPAEKEIFGSRTYSTSREASALSQLEYYKNEDNRRRGDNDYWTRSPWGGFGHGPEYVVRVLEDGSPSWYSSDDSNNAYFYGCI